MSERFANNTMTDKDADKVDAYLGKGTYEKWSELNTDGLGQLSRAEKLKERLWRFDHSLSVLYPYGTDWIQKVHDDFASGLDLIVDSKFADPAQFPPLFDLYPKVIDAASLVMDDAESIPLSGLVVGALGFRAAGFMIAARELHDTLIELDHVLFEAMGDEVEAQIKGGLKMALNAVGLMLPGLSLIAKGGLTMAEILLERESKPGVVRQGAKFGSEAIEEVDRIGHTVKRVSARGGKIIAISGFYFDVDEMLEAHKNVKEIKKLMEEAKKEYEKIEGKVSAAVKAMNDVQHLIDAGSRTMRSEIYAKERERDDVVEKYSYSLLKPLQWRIISDLSPMGRTLQ